MRIMTLNLNGVRQACKKGLIEWLANENFDAICFQEIRSDEIIFLSLMEPLKEYYAYAFPAQKPGYSGVALLTREKPTEIITGLGFESADEEGRYLEARFNDLRIASIYMPSGTSGEIRQQVKFEFLLHFKNHLTRVHQSRDKYILCGDFNIAHKTIDLKNWRSNRKNAGFLPEERLWMDFLIEDMAFTDAFRAVNSAPEQYTWWSHRGKSWEKNVGWRIDYQVVTPNLTQSIRQAEIFKNHRFSDHAPLIIDYAISHSLHFRKGEKNHEKEF